MFARMGCGFKRNEVTGDWQLHDLNSSPNILVNESRRMRWGCMWRVWGERRKVHTGFWCGNLREGNHLEGISLNGRIILKWI